MGSGAGSHVTAYKPDAKFRVIATHPFGPVEQADAGVILNEILLRGPLADRALHAQLSLWAFTQEVSVSRRSKC